jgi:hypothetical protein
MAYVCCYATKIKDPFRFKREDTDELYDRMIQTAAISAAACESVLRQRDMNGKTFYGPIEVITGTKLPKPILSSGITCENRWQRDAGLRLDHLLLNPKAAKRLAKSGVDRDVRGEENAPAWIVLGDAPAARGKPARTAAKPAPRKSAPAALRASPVNTPAAIGDRRRFIRPPFLRRLAEDNPSMQPQASRRHPRLRQYSAASLPRGAAARSPCRLGHA